MFEPSNTLLLDRETTCNCETNYPLVIDAFRTQFAIDPDATVAEHGSARLTMEELAGHAAAIAGVLSRLDLGTHRVVGVYAYPGFELLSGLWGVLFSGAAYCPLSPDYPVDRLRTMIDQAAIKVIVCQASQVSALRDVCGPHVEILTLDNALHRDNGRSALTCENADDLAYVIFTSGSTGKPKGVMIEHRNIASQMAWFAQSFLRDGPEVILQKTPFSFDAAQWELLASGYGAKLVFGDAHSYRNPSAQIDLIRDHGVTMLQGVPTLWRALVETERLRDCTSLKWLFSGGEALPVQLVRDCLRALPGRRMINLYGPTECTINATAFDCSALLADHPFSSAPIGKAVANTELVVIKDTGEIAGPGEQGELTISGVQVGRGYIGRPDLTHERFQRSSCPKGCRSYRTGDIVQVMPCGALQFLSRVDGQVKVRGYRIELDEVRSAIENHDWVKTAGVFVRQNPHSGVDELVACVELSPHQAQLMDQGHASAHHMSKASKLQVKAQITQAGRMTEAELDRRPSLALPGRTPTLDQERLAFGRKTYRHFKSQQPACLNDLLRLLEVPCARQGRGHLADVGLETLGHMLRLLGAFRSPERLLPKFAYASPGALYPTQVFVELRGIAGLRAGLYYYHPGSHSLHLMAPLTASTTHALAFHFLGKHRAIEPVYKLNIKEVLEFEVGHILGLLDTVLGEHGFVISGHRHQDDVARLLNAEPNDHYMGAFVVGGDTSVSWQGPAVTRYLQVHGDRVEGAAPGFYKVDRELKAVSTDRVEKQHVVAINQRVLEASAFGLALCVEAEDDPLSYMALGRALQHLQMNTLGYGFMSSGYSSRSGNDQRVVARLSALLHRRPGAVYFCVGGRISDEQFNHRGMAEDAVHTKGPAELIREDLVTVLPDFMRPSRIRIVPSIPTSANGKVDLAALRALDAADTVTMGERVAPRTPLEADIATHWQSVLKQADVSVVEDFFEAGGDSLAAVALVSQLNAALGTSLPLETLFEASTIERLAHRIQAKGASSAARLIRLADGTGRPLFVWPGLGGYPMSLRALARHLATSGRPVFALQAVGLNADEQPAHSVLAAARLDMQLIQAIQPVGPYTLIGYSFGARLAHKTAQLLEATGQRVDHVILAAPGNPRLEGEVPQPNNTEHGFEDPRDTAVLLSVFTQTLQGPVVTEGLARIKDDASFMDYVASLRPNFDRAVLERIYTVARRRYGERDQPDDVHNRKLQASVTVLEARGDDASFARSDKGLAHAPPRFVALASDHYALLGEPEVAPFASRILQDLNEPLSELVA